MGMFDNVRCRYSLPWPDAKEDGWQTKSMLTPYLDLYEIREDGTLWHEEYDLRMEENEKAPLGICQYQDNPRWLQVTDYNGALEIHGHGRSVVFWFRDGVVKDMFVVDETA